MTIIARAEAAAGNPMSLPPIVDGVRKFGMKAALNGGERYSSSDSTMPWDAKSDSQIVAMMDMSGARPPLTSVVSACK